MTHRNIGAKSKNLVKQVRTRKQAAKASTRSTSKHEVARLNEKIEKDEALRPMRAGRIGKNSALMLPTLQSKKKLRKMAQQAKVLGKTEVAMMDEDEEKGPAAEEETDPTMIIVPTKSATGTTLGKPGVKV
ncbi:hypothetical protein BC829DRAFT_443332 [Chytridium lagenaria]|nr:hypothetical protein BC829DRAFT_443332 [Chytridium lagenaria]